jgi:hypothetical protein
MDTKLRIAPAVALLVLSSLVGAATLQAKGSKLMTRGRLALELARAAGIGTGDSSIASQADATKALNGVGIELGGELGDAVSEQDLVEIGSALGVTVKTSTPDQSVTDEKGKAFVLSLEPNLQGIKTSLHSSGTTDIHISCQGRLSRAGRRGTPASPANPNATAPPCP